MSSFQLSDVLSVDSQFGRSINLERDFYSDLTIDGYVVTSTTVRSLSRVVEAIKSRGSNRAWTLTGPYGSGKSTFGLFVGKIFDIRATIDTTKARELLKISGKELWFDLFSKPKSNVELFSILVSGASEPVVDAVLRGIRSALERSGYPGLEAVKRKVNKLSGSDDVSGRDLIELIDAISNVVQEKNPRAGVLLIIDELGKLLEYAANRGRPADIFVLQELAEAANDQSRQFFLITALHQAFDQYARRLKREDREEWMKIQGRFEDLAFQEPNEQILHILRKVYSDRSGLPEHELMEIIGTRLAERACRLGLCGSLNEVEAIGLLRDAVPLHPLVSLTLGTVFRRFGQNERSLFAFLTSSEPFGLQEFLRNTEWDDRKQRLLTLDVVYDYLVSALGSSLYAGPEARKWTEIEAAISRLGADADELAVRLIKTIGLLRLIGETGNIKASREILEFSLTEPGISTTSIVKALSSLEERSIVVERHFNDTFAIWEGSDVNVEARIREAERQIDRSIPLADVLRKNFRLRPIVAKRHSFETGTLRYFEIEYADAQNIDAVAKMPLSQADGRVVYVLPGNIHEAESIVHRFENNEVAAGPTTVFVVLDQTEPLRDWIFRDECCRWARRNTPELEGDRTARLELAAQQNIAEQAIVSWIGDVQSRVSLSGSRWFWAGEELKTETARALQSELSRVFDEIYSDAPTLLNELINRKGLSSAAAMARRLLIEAMIANPGKERLGIEGNPPHLSMYLSILQRTTIHRDVDGVIGIYPPSNTAEKKVRKLWKRIEQFILATEEERRTVLQFFELLSAPPFGLKAGVHPVLITAVLIHFESELALYEQGNFVAKLTLPVLERLMRSPQKFELHFCRIAGSLVQALHQMIRAFAKKDVIIDPVNQKYDLLTLVRPLAKFASGLDSYTRHTNRLSESAKGIRRALLSAREPDRLLFKMLPEACGFTEFKSESEESPKLIAEFSQVLFDGIGAIKRAHDDLLKTVEEMIQEGFHVIGRGAELRAELARRSANIERFVADRKLKSFVIRSQNIDGDIATWIESLAALFAGKPTKTWNDDDVDRLQVSIMDVARTFINLERVVFALNEQNGAQDGSNLLRLSLTRLGEREHERVLSLTTKDQQEVLRLEQLIEEAFVAAGINGNLDIRLSALASLSWKMMEMADDKAKAKISGID